MVLVTAPVQASMKDEADEEKSKLSLTRHSQAHTAQSETVSSVSSNEDDSNLKYQLQGMPKNVLCIVMRFLDLRSLNRLSYASKHFYQIASDNETWTILLTRNKIVPLLGKRWNSYPPYILSYKSYYAALHLLQNLPKGGMERVKGHLHSAILPTSEFSHICLYFFYKIFDQHERAFECLYNVVELGNELILEHIVDDLYEGKFEASKLSLGERFQKLSSLAEKVWKRAQKILTKALHKGELDQEKRPKEERYKELLSLAEKGWKPARSVVVDILYSGGFGQDQIQGEERYQKLSSYADRGWHGAPEMLVEALVMGKLGQDKKVVEQRYQELCSLAERGTPGAKANLVYVLKWGRLGQDKTLERERYQALVSLGEKGCEVAQYTVIGIVKDEGLGWNKRSGEERYQELFALAEKKSTCGVI